jgi:hypothetical protein
VWSERSRRSSARSSCTAHPSTFGSRSSTTPTSCTTSRGAARSWTTRRTSPRARPWCSRLTVAPSVRERRAPQPPDDRRDCPLVTKVRPGRRYAADGCTVVLIGHAGREVVGRWRDPRLDRARRVEERVAGSTSPDARLAYVTRTTLRSTRRATIAALHDQFPSIRRPSAGHLLCDLEPAVGCEGAAREDRPAARDRFATVELEPPRRDGAGGCRRI